MIPYKQRVPFETRLAEASRITEKFPGRVPVIVERSPSADKKVPILDKEKFLVPRDLTVSQFIYVIRKRLALPSEMAMFLFVNGTLPTTNMLLSELYSINKDRDGFMYAQYSGENTFGKEMYTVIWQISEKKEVIYQTFDDWYTAIEFTQALAEDHGDMMCVLRFASKDICDTEGYTTTHIARESGHKLIIAKE